MIRRSLVLSLLLVSVLCAKDDPKQSKLPEFDDVPIARIEDYLLEQLEDPLSLKVRDMTVGELVAELRKISALEPSVTSFESTTDVEQLLYVLNDRKNGGLCYILHIATRPPKERQVDDPLLRKVIGVGLAIDADGVRFIDALVPLRFPFEKKAANKSSEPTSPSGRGSP